ncbi:hypothetical protein EAO30_01725 [Klebsiella pneumoniae]|nr:hypothetical protein EAO30_01725 [Klebsiella pneumoniae]
MLKINNLINSRGEYEPASFNEPHLFTTLPALDEEKERPMIFYCARKPANLPPGDGRAGILRLSGWRRGWQSPLYTSQSSSSYCAPGCRYRHHGGRHR